MRWIPVFIRLMMMVVAACFAGCGGDPPADGGAAGDADTDSDAGTDSDADTDGEFEACVPGDDGSWVMDLPAGIASSGQDIVTVTFASADPAFIDVGTALGQNMVETIQSLIDLQRPVFAWLDADTRHIEQVIMPLKGRVLSLTPTAEYVEVVLTYSAAAHRLWNGNECFEHLYAVLAAALDGQAHVEVSSDEVQGIVDVRPPF